MGCPRLPPAAGGHKNAFDWSPLQQRRSFNLNRYDCEIFFYWYSYCCRCLRFTCILQLPFPGEILLQKRCAGKEQTRPGPGSPGLRAPGPHELSLGLEARRVGAMGHRLLEGGRQGLLLQWGRRRVHAPQAFHETKLANEVCSKLAPVLRADTEPDSIHSTCSPPRIRTHHKQVHPRWPTCATAGCFCMFRTTGPSSAPARRYPTVSAGGCEFRTTFEGMLSPNRCKSRGVSYEDLPTLPAPTSQHTLAAIIADRRQAQRCTTPNDANDYATGGSHLRPASLTKSPPGPAAPASSSCATLG